MWKTWVAYYNGLAAGQSVTIATNSVNVSGVGNGGNWIPSKSGEISLMAFVDDLNRLTESNEENNKMTRNLVVAAAGGTGGGTNPVINTGSNSTTPIINNPTPTAPTPINGNCGSARGQTFSSTPTTNLCSAGNATAVNTMNTSYGWSCTGVNSGTTMSCTANKPAPAPTPVNGVCGSSNGANLTTVPNTNLCNAGTPSSVSGTGPWYWSCTGVNGGTTPKCSATKQTPAPAPTPTPNTNPIQTPIS